MLQLTQKQKFIFSEISILAWAASVQRAKLYNADLKPKNRRSVEFRAEVLRFIESELLPCYKSECDEILHVENIKRLADFGTDIGKGLLCEDGYKFGVAQKLLNLLLKYLWCLGHIPEPPHCPVDRLILEKTNLRGKINWTSITRASEYQRAICAIKSVAQSCGLSIAEWECQFYARR